MIFTVKAIATAEMNAVAVTPAAPGQDIVARRILVAETVIDTMVTADPIHLKEVRQGAKYRSLRTTTNRTKYFRNL